MMDSWNVLPQFRRRTNYYEGQSAIKKYAGKFHLELGEVRKIARGEVGDQAWGHYCFPSINYTKTGAIMSRWGYGEDKVGGKAHDGGIRPPRERAPSRPPASIRNFCPWTTTACCGSTRTSRTKTKTASPPRPYWYGRLRW